MNTPENTVIDGNDTLLRRMGKMFLPSREKLRLKTEDELHERQKKAHDAHEQWIRAESQRHTEANAVKMELGSLENLDLELFNEGKGLVKDLTKQAEELGQAIGKAEVARALNDATVDLDKLTARAAELRKYMTDTRRKIEAVKDKQVEVQNQIEALRAKLK